MIFGVGLSPWTPTPDMIAASVNGSSGTPIGLKGWTKTKWVLTAHHVFANWNEEPPFPVVIEGVPYTYQRRIRINVKNFLAPQTDLALIQVVEDIPRFHELIESPPQVGEETRTGGFGLYGNTVDPWNPSQEATFGYSGLHWGSNKISAKNTTETGAGLFCSFDRNDVVDWVTANEAAAYSNDSGSGVLVQRDGKWKIAGVVVSGNPAYGLSPPYDPPEAGYQAGLVAWDLHYPLYLNWIKNTLALGDMPVGGGDMAEVIEIKPEVVAIVEITEAVGPPGPQGPQGETGPQGPPGSTIDPDVDGPTDIDIATSPASVPSEPGVSTRYARADHSHGGLQFGTAAGTICQGNDSRLSNARTPTAHVHAASDVTSGVFPIARGGTNAGSKTAAFTNLSPATTAGDLIQYDGAEHVRIPIGSSGQVLTVSGGAPVWAAPSGGGGGGSGDALLAGTGQNWTGTNFYAQNALALKNADASVVTLNKAAGINQTVEFPNQSGIVVVFSNEIQVAVFGASLLEAESPGDAQALLELGTASLLNVGTTAGTVCAGDDSRLSDARTPVAHNQAWSTITSTPTDLAGYGITDAQALNADLTAISGLSPTNNDFMQRKLGAWTNRTVSQVKTDLGLTGTNSGDQTITLTGDVTGSGTASFAATIANGAVTLAKMANLAQDTLIGRQTASTGVPEAVTCTAAGRALLDDADAAAQRVTLGLGILHPGYKSGNTYTEPYRRSGAAMTATADRIYYVPIVIQKAVTISALNFQQGGTLSGSGWVIGIYNSANGVPTSKIAGATSGDGLLTDTTKSWSVSQTLQPGVYFIAFTTDGVSGTEQPSGITETSVSPLGHSSDSTTSITLGYYESGSALTLPTNAGSLTAITSGASVPSLGWTAA